MTLALSAPVLNRADALLLARETLLRLTQRLGDPPPAPYLADAYRAWDARLEAAARLSPDWQLSELATASLRQMVSELASLTDPETIVDWLDLLPRSALAIVDLQPIAMQKSAAASPVPSNLTNKRNDAAHWTPDRREPRADLWRIGSLLPAA